MEFKFCFQAQTVDPVSIIAKLLLLLSQLLSQIAQTHDPLGLLAPATGALKIMLQDLWLAEVSYDEPIPLHILEKWLKFQSELPHLKGIQIP